MKPLLAALFFTASANGALAQDAAIIPAATIHPFPEFECWDKSNPQDPRAIFNQSLVGGSQTFEHGTVLPNGTAAYPQDHIDLWGNPSRYNLDAWQYFHPEYQETIEKQFKNLDHLYDREAIRAMMDAYMKSDDEICPTSQGHAAMLLG